MNPFVQYLDQFNVLSPSHAKIYDEYTQHTDPFRFSIDTKIEHFLLSLFANTPCSVVMTGNAGDGKTRLCRTVFEKLTGTPLTEWPNSGIVEAKFGKGTLRIVKDLSELTETVILQELENLQRQIAEHHTNGVYYLIAANEGKLTKFLSKYGSLTGLLEQIKERFMDHRRNDDSFFLVNLQDVTSSIYAERIIEAWNQEDNWKACSQCSKQTTCIINLNHRRMSREIVRNNLVEQYRLLDCLGIHVTMREILIHISYTLTGGLTCEQVLKADYQDIEVHSKLAYYDNFFGVHMPDSGSRELGMIRHFERLDPGQFSISSIDDFLLNGDISGDLHIVNRHHTLFNDEIDLLFGYYRKLIDLYRTQNPDRDNRLIFDQIPRFRRKYYFEIEETERTMQQKLVPYLHFKRFIDSLTNKQTLTAVRKELILGLNHAFAKKLIHRNETQLFAVNENLMIHEAFSASQVKMTVDEERLDIDYIPSKFFLAVNGYAQLEIRLPVFEYLLRLAGGGLLMTLKQEVEILLSTFKNDLISRSEPDEYSLQVLAIDPDKGVYTQRQIDI